MNATMEQIETLAKSYASARDELAERLQSLRDEQEQAKRRRLQGIKNSVARFAAAREELRETIDANRELFDKPRTRILHGTRLGLMKQRGTIEIEDAAACIAALRRLLGDEAEVYIRRSEQPVKSALANLPVKDLKRIGATVTDDVDTVVIKSADADIDKLIGALLSDPELEEAAP